MAKSKDPRIGKRVELHPATDQWMMGDRYGTIVGISTKSHSYLDPKDSRNGHTFRIKMDKSQKTLRVYEGHILSVF